MKQQGSVEADAVVDGHEHGAVVPAGVCHSGARQRGVRAGKDDGATIAQEGAFASRRDEVRVAADLAEGRAAILHETRARLRVANGTAGFRAHRAPGRVEPMVRPHTVVRTTHGVPVRGSGLEPFFMMQLRMIAMTPPVLVSASEVSSFPGRCKSGVQSQLPPWVSEKITTDPLFESD